MTADSVDESPELSERPLSARLLKACAALAYPALKPIRERLVDPGVRVAVVGRLNAGKSTLVNALLRHAVAPVAAGECTTITTTFGYGAREAAVAEMSDGTEVEVSLGTERRLPAELPVDGEQVVRLRVDLSSDVLRGMTLIDTPGLDTTTRALAGHAEQLLGIDAAGQLPHVDAVLYVMPQARGTDIDRLSRLRGLVGDQGAALATIGVLTKADRLSPDGSLDVAARMADSLCAELRGTVASVLPVVGLWAETADADGLTEDDVRALRAVQALGEGERMLAASSAQRFAGLALEGVSTERLQRLLDRLDLTGVRALLASDLSSAHRVNTTLREWSGIARVRESLDQLVRHRGDLLRAHSAVIAMRTVAWSADVTAAEREQLLNEIDAVETAPEYHVWLEARALADFVDGTGTGDESTDQEAIRILTTRDVHERFALPATASAEDVRSAATAGYRRWTGIVNSPQTSLSARRAAEVVRRSCLLCYRELGES